MGFESTLVFGDWLHAYLLLSIPWLSFLNSDLIDHMSIIVGRWHCSEIWG
jgi:hypothetical protein